MWRCAVLMAVIEGQAIACGGVGSGAGSGSSPWRQVPRTPRAVLAVVIHPANEVDLRCKVSSALPQSLSHKPLPTSLNCLSMRPRAS